MSKFIPNSFQIPNAFVDEVMFALSGNAVKAYLLVARKTTGWQKESDFISIEQFKQFTGINRDKTIYEILKELEEVGLIRTVKTAGRTTEFYLVKDLPNVENKPVAKNATSGEKRHQLQKTPPVAKSATTPVAENATSGEKRHQLQKTPPVAKSATTPVAENATATSGEKRHPTKTNNKTNINPPPIVPPAEQVVLDYLNIALANLAEEQGERKPTGYKLTDKTKQAIGARLAEFDLGVCKRVVDYLVSKWGRDPKMVEYLRPSTIFRPTNFGEYVVGSERWDNKGRPEMRDGAWVMADGTMLKPKGSAPNPASKSTDWAKGRQIQIRNPQVAEKLRKMGMLK